MTKRAFFQPRWRDIVEGNFRGKSTGSSHVLEESREQR